MRTLHVAMVIRIDSGFLYHSGQKSGVPIFICDTVQKVIIVHADGRVRTMRTMRSAIRRSRSAGDARCVTRGHPLGAGVAASLRRRAFALSARWRRAAGTAVVESKVDEAVRTRLAQGLKLFDRAFEKRIRRAQTDGELSADADAAVLARVASAILHSLALRSRAGDSRASLRATAAEGVALICGARNHTAPKAASMTGTRKRFEK